MNPIILSGSVGSKYVTNRGLTELEPPPSQKKVALKRVVPIRSGSPSFSETVHLPCAVVWGLINSIASSASTVPSANRVGIMGTSGGRALGTLGQAPHAALQNAACSRESSTGSAGQGLAIPNQAPMCVLFLPLILSARTWLGIPTLITNEALRPASARTASPVIKLRTENTPRFGLAGSFNLATSTLLIGPPSLSVDT